MCRLSRLFLLLCFVLLVGCRSSPAWSLLGFESSEASRLEPLPQDPFIQVYLNQNFTKGADYTDPYRQIKRPGDDLEAVIVDAIANAQTSIDVAVQEIRLPRIAQALAAKHQAGVKVRVIIENTYNQPWLEKKKSHNSRTSPYDEFLALADQNRDGQLSELEVAQADAIVIFRNAQVPLLDDTADGSKGSGLMHHKFLVVDGVRVVTGSANWTPSGVHGDPGAPLSRGNTNNLVVIEHPTLAQAFTQEFDLMWGDGPGRNPDSVFGVKKPQRSPQTLQIGASNVTLNFSPISPTKPWQDSTNGVIGRVLQQAQSQVDLALFVFSDQPLVDILRDRHQQGVAIRALIDPSFAFRNFSEGLDMLGVVRLRNCQAEANNQPWSTPINTVGMASLPPGDKLHHKVAIVDQRIVITGSHNWSAAANHNNDETLLVIENPTVAAHFQREFEALYQNASLGLPPKIQDKIAQAAAECN